MRRGTVGLNEKRSDTDVKERERRDKERNSGTER